ncbi:MAG: hypothetical protein ABI026_00635, partial [Gemmatimonadaceae bacterium]
IRESSSDLLVQNCDEYYSYNALAGLVNTREEDVAKWDPWQLAGEAVERMKRNGDVMRADRLKQVMQQIDSSFDEKNLGMSKFTRFVQEAAHRGILTSHKMDNGQLEVDLPKAGATAAAEAPSEESDDTATAAATTAAPPPRESRSRRGRGGRGRDRERPRTDHVEGATPTVTGEHATVDVPVIVPVDATSEVQPSVAAAESVPPVEEARPTVSSTISSRPAMPERQAPPPRAEAPADGIGVSGVRLTRDEAFDLMRRAVDHIASHGGGTRASDVRRVAHDLLGRDSESLSEKNFTRILKDAHDSDIIDLRRRGDDYEVRPAVVAAPIGDQLGAAAVANAPVRPASAPVPRGMGARGGGGRSQRHPTPTTTLPLDLLSVGVVDYDTPAITSSPAPSTPPTPKVAEPVAVTPAEPPKPTRGRKAPAKKTATAKVAKKPTTSPKPVAKKKPVRR